MILDVVSWIFIVLLLIKLISNFILPYRAMRLRPDEGISLGFTLLGDLLLFVALFFVSWTRGQQDAQNNHTHVVFGAGTSIVISYAHYFVVLSITNWIQQVKNKK